MSLGILSGCRVFLFGWIGGKAGKALFLLYIELLVLKKLNGTHVNDLGTS
jgi:hypothetical protein